jgi:hypothetical protein
MSYFELERRCLVEEIEAIKAKIARIDLLLAHPDSGKVSALEGPITVMRADPYALLTRWPMTAVTTMGRCREALELFGREATAEEIKNLIQHQTKSIPAKSITSMLYKRGSKEQSGIYRVSGRLGPAKYGLIRWRQGAKRDSAGPDGFSASEEEIPL